MIVFHLLWDSQVFESIRAKNSPIVAVPSGEAMLSHDGAERWVSIWLFTTQKKTSQSTEKPSEHNDSGKWSQIYIHLMSLRVIQFNQNILILQQERDIKIKEDYIDSLCSRQLNSEWMDFMSALRLKVYTNLISSRWSF